MAELDLFFKIFFFLFGAIVGSFLNVCIVRLPQGQSVVAPRSRCVHCEKTIPWHDNIPLISYVRLGGRCRFCKKKVSFRYFLVESLTAAAFVLFYKTFGLTPLLLPYLLLTCGFIAATFIDLEHRIIPDEITIGGMFAGLALSIFIPQMQDTAVWTISSGRVLMRILVAIFFVAYFLNFFIKKEPILKEDNELFIFIGILFLVDVFIGLSIRPGDVLDGIKAYMINLDASLLGLLVGGGLIYSMGMLGDFLFKKESMGGGDVKLLAMIGAFLGWKLAVLSFFIAPVFGALVGIVIKIKTNESVIAYGPFLSLGALMSIFWGDAILAWILAGHGL